MNTIIQDLESIDKCASRNDDNTIEAVRDCVHRPLSWISRQVIEHAAWRRHVRFLIQTLVPRWAFVLTTTKEDYDALVFTLVGSPSAAPCLRTFMASISLPILLDCIRDHHTREHTSLDTLDIYSALLKQIVSRHMLSVFLRGSPAIEIDLASFCSLLCSIPSRLSNAYGLQLATDKDSQLWYIDRNFHPLLAKCVAMEIDSICQTVSPVNAVNEKQTMVPLIMARELVGKMIRQGYQDLCVETMIPIAVHQYRMHPEPQCSATWCYLWTLCEDIAPSEKIYGSIFTYIYRLWEPVRQQLLQQQRSSLTANGSSTPALSNIKSIVQSTAYDLSSILFHKSKQSRQQQTRVQNFLSYAIKDLSKNRRKDDLVLRTVVAIAMHASGLEALNTYEMTDDRVWRLSTEASNLVARLLPDVIGMWTDPVFIRQSSDIERQYVTTSLLILFGYADDSVINEMQHSTGIVMGISTWLKTGDEDTAKLAMIVAESMANRPKLKENDKKALDFGISMEQRLTDMKELAKIGDGLTKIVTNATLISSDTTLPLDNDGQGDENFLGESSQDLDPDALITNDDDDEDDEEEEEEEEDSDLEPYPMEDESDDDENQADTEPDPKKKKIRAPVYISELINYLKDSEDPKKLEIGLNASEQVIRQKANIGTEIEEWAIELGKLLIHFPDDYSIENHRKLQQSALVALMVACPEKISHYIIEEFFSQNTTISQKTIILASISMVTFELSGWDSSRKKDNKDADFITEQMNMLLPPSQATSTTNLVEAAKAGKVLFSSSRAQAERRRQNGTVRNRLSGLAATILFYPLIGGWWESSRTKLKWIMQDPSLVERFIMTLNVIMQCASNTPDKRKLVKGYFEFALSIRYVPKLSPRTLRALLLGINTILHVCYKDQGKLLLTDYTLELSECFQWLEDIIETHQNDTELVQLAVALLASINRTSTTINPLQ